MSAASRPDKATVAAVGAGRMGRGIALIFAYAGHPVRLIDLKPRPAAAAAKLLDEALEEIRADLGFLVSLSVLSAAQAETVLGWIETHDAAGAAAAMTTSEVLFEAVPEVLEAKQAALAQISAAAAPTAIIASTTSTMLVDTLAGFVTGPGRFLNSHFLNPAYLIPLVEVSPGTDTTEATVAAMLALLEAAGKKPVRCAATPGFIVPRIQALAMNEAARMVEEGVASAEDIDRAIRYGFGVRFAVLGLVEFIDWGGGDILYYASQYLRQALDSERYAAPDVVDRNMAEGRLGLRSGQGFYDFRQRDTEAYRRERLSEFVALLRHLELLPGPAD